MPYVLSSYRESVQCATLMFLWALMVLAIDIPSAMGQPSILPPYRFDGGPDYIFAEGSWIGDTPARDPYWRDFAFQTSTIRCDRVRMTCLEARASWKSGVMFSKLVEYNVRQWDQDKVIALLDGMAATIELRFDLKKQVIVLTHDEKPELHSPRRLPAFAHLDDGTKAIENAKTR
jgi:hypothetical protein